MSLIVAPTEPAPLRELGSVSLLPEEYGVDFLFGSKLGLVGVQRKQFPDDFLASVHDGRLNREYAMMRELDYAVLLLEGKEHWSTEGKLIRGRNNKRNGWTRTQHRNYLASVQLRGITIAHTDSIKDTGAYLSDLEKWGNKNDHSGLETRPAAKGSGWGTVKNADYQKYLLQSLPGIGPKQAAAILQDLGMIIGLKKEVTMEALMSVPGIGKKKAERIVRVFNG